MTRQPTTIKGQMRHFRRALIVVFHRGFARPMHPYLMLVNDHPMSARLAARPMWQFALLGIMLGVALALSR